MKKWTQKEVDYLRDNASQTNAEIGVALQRSEESVFNKRKRLGLIQPVPHLDPLAAARASRENKTYKAKFEEVQSKLLDTQKELDAYLEIKDRIDTFKIEPRELSQVSESTAVVLLSDWHFEEIVKPQQVNGLNKYTTDVAEERIIYLFQVIVKYIKLHQKETEINNLVLALLGDFISGTIHDDLKEGNELMPVEAIWKVQNLIASGIEHILHNTDVNLIIPCCSGNHGRITDKQRVATESGNSLEWLMYMNLDRYFHGNKRVNFIINEGYINYVDVFGYKLRFHHGHSIKYGGGIGGIFIPVYKAISQWNKTPNKADLDCFGHFHQMKDGGNFISNGSVIGYNAFAVKIKADYEKPRQAFFLIDKQRFVICVRPIILNGNIKKGT